MYKIPRFVKFLIPFKKFEFEYNDNLYEKEINGNNEIRQISLLVEALNIKNKKERYDFIYEKSCDLLDDVF